MKKGFTLIELLAVIIILGIIALLTVPVINNALINSRERSYNAQVAMIIDAATRWLVNNTECDPKEADCFVGVEELISEGFITRPRNGYLRDPRNAQRMDGCVIISFSERYQQDEFIYIEASCLQIEQGTLMAIPWNVAQPTDIFLTLPIRRNQIESIETRNRIEVDINICIDNNTCADVSAEQNKSVIAWWEQGDNPDLYKVYIGAFGRVVANTNSDLLFHNLSNATHLNLTYLDTSMVTRMFRMFGRLDGSTSLSSIEFGLNFVTDNVMVMDDIFMHLTNLTEIITPDGINVINWDTSNVISMGGMFFNTSLSSIEFGPNFVTDNVRNMGGMFARMINLTEIITPAGVNVINWDTSNVINMQSMFSTIRLSSIEFGSNFVTDNVRYMQIMFGGTNLTEIITPAGRNVINWDTRNVTNMGLMFNNTRLSSIEFGSNFVTSNVINMQSMFTWMTNLTEIITPAGRNVINWDTSKVTHMASMFYNTSLSSIEFGPNFVTDNVRNMWGMFARMSNLNNTQGLDIRHFNFSNVTDHGDMLYRTPTTARLTVNPAGNTWLNNNGFSAWNNRVIVP